MHIKKEIKIQIIGIIIIIMGILIGVIPIFIQRKEIKIEDTKVEEYIENTKSEEVVEEIVEDNKGIKDEEGYILVLEIPKINLKRGVYNIGSKLNNIGKNVTIMKESTLPDIKNGNLVLEAHSGVGKIAYFNKLHKLNVGDDAYIYYNGNKYIYKVDNIYDVLKDGKVEVVRDVEKTTLTLITCKKDTNDRQMVIILYLIDKEEY